MTDLRSRLAGEGYEVLELLGRGGMGEVYRARQTALDRPVAIKLLATGDPEAHSRFCREARVQAALHHENLVEVYGFGETQDLPYLVMELLDARTLRQVMAGPKLPTEQVVEILLQVCDALQFVHERGIVHRDVKPDNIFLLRDGRVKLGDFGIARTETAGSTLTQRDVIVGSLPYLAPERFAGHASDPRSDQYALGVTAYELFCGQVPFTGYPRTRKERPPPLSGPIRLGAAIERSVSFSMEDRFATMAELREAMAGSTTGRHEAEAARQPAPPVRRVTPGTLGLLAVLVLAGGAIGFRASREPGRFSARGVAPRALPHRGPDRRAA